MAFLSHVLLNLVLDVDKIFAIALQRKLEVDDWVSLGNIMTDLANYTESHFVYEEGLMRKHGYPKLAEHIKLHNNLREELGIIRQQVKSRHDFISSELRKWLLEWLFVHINSFDLDYKPLLEGKC